MHGCLIVHGLTGTPGCVASLKNQLVQDGFVVRSPCLAGHGTTIDDLRKVTWQDWYDTVHLNFAELKRSCEKVYYAGISLGALLGLKLAIEEGWGVRALALLGTPLILSPLETFAIKIVKNTPLKHIVKSIKKDLFKSVNDPEGRILYKQMSLPRIPSEAVYELCKLREIVFKDMKKITNPLYLIHAKKDHVAPVKNVSLIKNMVSSDIVENLILNQSQHVITLDFEKEMVAKQVVNFFAKFH